jgi:ribonuclease Y
VYSVELTALALGVLVALLLFAVTRLATQLGSSKATAATAEEGARALEQDLSRRLEQGRKEADLAVKEAVAEARDKLDRENQHRRDRLSDDEVRTTAQAAELDRRAGHAERRDEALQGREMKLAEDVASAQATFAEARELRVKASAEAQETRDQAAAQAQQVRDEASSEAARLGDEASAALEAVAGLTREDARVELLARVEQESRSLLARRIMEVEQEVGERAEQTAKNLISMAIQRYAGEYVCERTVSVVSLESDELKGRIIGREGRNIRALEAATGVDFIIDDTPNQIVISAFNPIRREVARRALETLLEDGRVHPSRIDAVVRKAESEFHRVIRAAGEEAADEVGITGIHPEILKLIGALKYRTSYGQNQWQHSIEAAFIAGMMAAELGLDIKRAKRSGLLHDIGKVLDETAEGSHALIGAEFARKHGEDAVVCNAIAAHHEEVPQETVYAVLAQAADAISGARPGARREMMQTYTHRLTDLERISNSFPGVDRSYAVQAGREIRVLVENAQVSDAEAVLLSQGIARKIESEMQYPGQIKVTVIRETRVVQYAR